METSLRGVVLVYTLGLEEEEEGGTDCLCLSVEGVSEAQGRLQAPSSPSADPLLAPVGLWL